MLIQERECTQLESLRVENEKLKTDQVDLEKSLEFEISEKRKLEESVLLIQEREYKLLESLREKSEHDLNNNGKHEILLREKENQLSELVLMLENLNATLEEARLNMNAQESQVLDLTNQNEILESHNCALENNLNDNRQTISHNLQVLRFFSNK